MENFTLGLKKTLNHGILAKRSKILHFFHKIPIPDYSATTYDSNYFFQNGHL